MNLYLKKSHKRFVFIPLIFIGLCTFLHNVRAAENNTAYQLALLHTKAVNPEKVFLDGSIRPKDSTVAEFQWLLDSIKNRCVNSEESIVHTLISAWKLLQGRGYDMTLLETFRALTKNAQNKSLYGAKKVDFEKASGYWTSRFKPEKQ